MAEPQKRTRSRRGLKRSLNREKLGLKFKGWRTTTKGKRLGRSVTIYNAWQAHRRKRRKGL